ncbi:hypothetical protein [Rhizobium sp. BK602]|uniref:hypothetical protein n=1 Tax=Rhizobium sp. BK602 TaxID=2586986 RepID=UPI00160BFFF7|nr:hypothetical protein [Rhizobium sp. BK602]MBB3610217.1 hypothetical protein [Rhizobium sp. BK602]
MNKASRQMPDKVTHTYDPHGPFLANICDLSHEEAEKVLQRIRDTGHRAIKTNYLRRRHETENWLIRERHRLLGHTQRMRPIYFFLGNFADGKDHSRPNSLVMPLTAFPKGTITFTFPDSMASLPIATHKKYEFERQPYHGQVFSLEEIRHVIAKFGMPNESWAVDPRRRFDRFVEVQVWDDRPIVEYLRGLEAIAHNG